MPGSPRTAAVHAARRAIASRAGYSSPRSRSSSGRRGRSGSRATCSSIRRGERSLERHALVDVACGLRDAGDERRHKRLGLGRGGLGIADPDLDRAEGEVRAHRPPGLGGLDDRARAYEQLDALAIRRASRRTRRAHHSAGSSVKLCVRAECRPNSLPSRWGRWRRSRAAAAAGGSAGRGRAPRVQVAHADVHVQAEGVVAPRDVLEASCTRR